MVRSRCCQEAGTFFRKASTADACSKCFHLCNRDKLAALLQEWCMRLDYVHLLHRSIGPAEEQVEFASEMATRYPDLDSQTLASQTPHDLLVHCRRLFQHIGTAYQNPALVRFLALNLQPMSKTVLLQVPAAARSVVEKYIDAILNGRLGAAEVRVTWPRKMAVAQCQ